jgi:oxygen-dependent protoporphyrinogen oxidase
VQLTYVRRWPLALPHTKPGVYRAIAEFAESIDAGAPIQFAGDWLSQTGQNTAVAWGERAARNLVARAQCSPQ